MNFRKQYRQYVDQISPSEKLTDAVLNQAASGQMKRTFPRFPGKIIRPAASAAVFLLLCNLGLTALVAHAEPVYETIYAISPTLAQHFMPVHMSSEDQGIRMEVESVSISENTAEIYISMQDLTGGRIDGTMDLYDSYSINRPFDSAGTCQLADYDESSQKAFFLIRIDEAGDHKITGDKITFSVREFLSHKQIYRDLPIPLALSALSLDSPVMEAEYTGMSGDLETFDAGDSGTVLLPGEAFPDFPVNGIALTAAGYADGRLHLQTAVTNPLANDNHGYFYLQDADGNQLFCDYTVHFQAADDSAVVYQESVFDISPEEIEAYTLYGNFTTCDTKVEGNWQVTFSLQ